MSNSEDSDRERGGVPHEFCSVCGAGSSFLIPVWEEPEEYKRGNLPDYVGCTECETMVPLEEMGQSYNSDPATVPSSHGEHDEMAGNESTDSDRP